MYPTITLSKNSDFSEESPQFQLICTSTGSSKITWTSDYPSVSSSETSVPSVVDSKVEFIHTLTVTEKLGGLFTCTAPQGRPASNSAEFCIEGIILFPAFIAQRGS